MSELSGWDRRIEEVIEKLGLEGGRAFPLPLREIVGLVLQEQGESLEAVPSATYGTETTSFGGALNLLKEGRHVARSGWNGKGMWLALTRSAESARLNVDFEPFIYMRTAQGKYIPWLASQADLLADDWFEVQW